MSNWITNTFTTVEHALSSVFGSTATESFITAEKSLLKTALGTIVKDAVSAVQTDVTQPLNDAQWTLVAATISTKAVAAGFTLAEQEIDLLIALFASVKIS